ncbi:MAG: formimidoylglutamate deiminase [Alphaproteobacteria bacterium]|nr:formimidoylglutamate deiminase [Alphaproteobacteria bacterium]
MNLRWFRCEAARLPQGWSGPANIGVDDRGIIQSIGGEVPEDETAEVLRGCVMPGMANLHSHAFQRGMAGLAERQVAEGDDFWGWRALMYRFAAQLEPDDVRAIAAQAYLEMLRAGYTSVCEFHYLHHQRDGKPYAADRMAAALIEAARETGIALTLLPVLYRTSDFGAAPLPEQRRFIQTPEIFLERLAAFEADGAHIGVAFHSLRAVPAVDIEYVLARLRSDMPVHIHVAEQTAEVERCRAHTGQTPAAWLLDHCPVGKHWALVHATHVSEAEIAGLARSGATAVLCPSTEGNLADGIFPFDAYRAQGGRFGIGSDSHVTVDPSEELRWLDYGARLARRKRMPENEGPPHRGADLWLAAADTAVSGRAAGAIAVGQHADWIVADGEAAALAGRSGDAVIDTLVFGARTNLVRDVVVGGKVVVRRGRHQAAPDIKARYVRTVRALAGTA